MHSTDYAVPHVYPKFGATSPEPGPQLDRPSGNALTQLEVEIKTVLDSIRASESRPSIKPVPREWDVRIAPTVEGGVATAVWRVDPRAEDVEVRYYVVTDDVLVQIEAPQKAPERPIGFRSMLRERPE